MLFNIYDGSENIPVLRAIAVFMGFIPYYALIY